MQHSHSANPQNGFAARNVGTRAMIVSSTNSQLCSDCSAEVLPSCLQGLPNRASQSCQKLRSPALPFHADCHFNRGHTMYCIGHQHDAPWCRGHVRPARQIHVCNWVGHSVCRPSEACLETGMPAARTKTSLCSIHMCYVANCSLCLYVYVDVVALD